MPVLQIRAGQKSVIANCDLWPPIFITIIVTSGFSKKYFLLSFPGNSFEWSWAFLRIYTLLQNLQDKFVFFLSVHFLLVVPQSFCVLTLSTFSYFSTACKYTGWVCSLFACCFAATLYINALCTLCTFCITRGTNEKTKSFNLTSNTFCCQI